MIPVGIICVNCYHCRERATCTNTDITLKTEFSSSKEEKKLKSFQRYGVQDLSHISVFIHRLTSFPLLQALAAGTAAIGYQYSYIVHAYLAKSFIVSLLLTYLNLTISLLSGTLDLILRREYMELATFSDLLFSPWLTSTRFGLIRETKFRIWLKSL
jgi:hypothetical protein